MLVGAAIDKEENNTKFTLSLAASECSNISSSCFQQHSPYHAAGSTLSVISSEGPLKSLSLYRL